MSTPLLFYSCVTGFAVVMCLWATLTAIMGDPEHSGRHRMLTGTVAVACLAATAAAGLAGRLGIPQLAWTVALLPFLTVAATWSNVVSLRGAGPWISALGLPITLFNMLHVGIYSVAFVQDCLGVDLGTWGCALTSCDAHLQGVLGDRGGPENPVWYRLPIILPLWGSMNFTRHFALLGSSALSCVILVAFTLVMPHAFLRSASYHNASAADVVRARPVGMKVPWGRQPLSMKQRQRIRNHLRALGVSHVSYDVTSEIVKDATRLQQLQLETRWAASAGLQTIAITKPADRFSHLPALSVTDLRRDMAEAHWLVAERLQPDLLVLFAGPFGSLAEIIAGSTSSDEWLAVIRRSADEARQAHAGIRLAVSLEVCGSRGEAMFRTLKGDASPVDVVGFSIRPGDRFLVEVERDLQRMFNWCKRAPGTRPVLVIEAGCSPQINGGDRGRWNLLSRVMQFGDRARDVLGVGLDGLYDRRRDYGLVRRSGLRSLAYRLLAGGERRPAMQLPAAVGAAAARPGK